MKVIVTIGGGSIRTQATRAIDEEIIKLSGKQNPHFLFIPTASSDDQEYVATMREYFGANLGCIFDTLLLVSEHPLPSEIKSKIERADIIYVGGGNTLMMMRLWRTLGVDALLKKAYERGTVMCGLSAGSICWYEFGHSDSMSYYNPDKWNYIKVKGLGLIKGIHCPHYDSQTLGVPRRKNFQNMIAERGGFGIAVDDNCAIAYIDDSFKVLTSKKGAGAYQVFKQHGDVVEKKIEQRVASQPIALLYKK